MFTKTLTASKVHARGLIFNAMSSGLAMMVGSAVAFASSPAPDTSQMQNALNSVFGVLEGLANTIKAGITGIVLPVGTAVALYFVVRMLLASDQKDAAMYKKRAITVAILVALAFAIPGLMQAMSSLGESINNTLSASGSSSPA